MIPYRPDIDGLRAIAILSVLLFHAGSPIFSGGYAGVDIFFVISGYLITAIILKARSSGGFSYLHFYARRARRILPAFLAMITVVTLACFAIFLPVDLVEHGRLLVYTVLFGANFRLASTAGYFDTASQETPLLHMWSLSVEEQFYLLWPTLLLALIAWLPPRRLVVAVGLLALASLVCSQVELRAAPKLAFYQLPSRGWELLAGAALAMGLIPAVKQKITAEVLSILGMALMLGSITLYTRDTAFPGLAALPPVLGCALVIHAGTTVPTRVSAVLGLRPVVFLGLISYSLYLWHWPVFALPSYVLMRETTTAEASALAALAVVLAILSWRFVELPFRRPAQTKVGTPPTRKTVRYRLPLTQQAYVAVAMVVCLVISGAYFQLSAGAPWRGPGRTPLPSAGLDDQMPSACASRSVIENGTGLCALQEGGSPPGLRVVLLGDSHAAHYTPLIAAVYGGGTAYLRPACPPLLDVHAVYHWIDRRSRGCLDSTTHIIQKVVETKPDVAVLAGRWTLWEPFPYGQEKRSNVFLVKDDNDRRTLEISRRRFAESLKATVNRLTDAGIRVVLMGQVPELKNAISRCTQLSNYFGRDTASCFVTPRDELHRRQDYAYSVLESVASGRSDVAVFSPIPSMCDETQCFAARDGQDLYSDNNHLTGYGAVRLANAFRSSLPTAFVAPSPPHDQLTATPAETLAR